MTPQEMQQVFADVTKALPPQERRAFLKGMAAAYHHIASTTDLKATITTGNGGSSVVIDLAALARKEMEVARDAAAAAANAVTP